MGCCSKDKLLPAVLSKNVTNRHFFLEPESAASSSAASSSAASEEGGGGLGTGAIAGIAVGSAAFGIILISFLVCLSLRWRRKQKQSNTMLQSPESQRGSATVQSTPMGYGGQYFQSTSTVVPYYPSGVSSDYHNKPSPTLPMSPPNYNYHMNSIVDQNYGPPRQVMTLHEMDATDRDPHELDTEPVEENNHDMDRTPAPDSPVSHPASRIHHV
ncbi:hypothetical protein LB507_007555 [Fusarium sp. FIESC RH6]|nr:hypothetical protein LB507_007555 [Fusarium sp. FIESC RH6]